MFGKQKQMGWWIVIAAAMGMLCVSHVAAQKPVKPPPDEQPITYATVVLSNLEHELKALNQLELGDGVVEVVGRVWGNSGEIEVQKASHWMVEPSGAALMSFLRTLPPDAPVHSRATDVNNDGVIIGHARGRESFSEKAFPTWLVVARKRLPTPFASEPQCPSFPFDARSYGLRCAARGSGFFCAKHPKGRSGKGVLTWRVRLMPPITYAESRDQDLDELCDRSFWFFGMICNYSAPKTRL